MMYRILKLNLKLGFAVFSLAILLSALHSPGATINYFQNFENVGLGGDAPGDRVYQRLNAAEGDTKWNEYGSGGSDYSPFIQDEPNGSRILGMTYGYSSGYGWGNMLKREIGPITNDDPNHNFKFDFKTFTPSGTSESILEVTLQKAGWKWGIFVNIKWSSDDRSISISEATSSRTLATSWTDEIWYSVECNNIDISSNTYDIKIYERDNTSNVLADETGVNFYWVAGGSGYQGQLNQLTLQKYYQSYKTHLDNFSITPVPEPVSLTLMTLLSVIGIFKRRE